MFIWVSAYRLGRILDFWVISVVSILLLGIPNLNHGAAYIYAGNANGIDIITHPKGYTGTGGVITLTVGIDPNATLTTELEVAIQNNITIWNKLISETGNLHSGNDTPLNSSQFDFESVALHEMGHCLGLAHPNLASESGLSSPENNYTRTTTGVDATYNLGAGTDSVIGSADDSRGDDINLFWFSVQDNDPFNLALGNNINFNTYSIDIADLPNGHSFAANPDRAVSTLLGYPDTESVMQQGTFTDEMQRRLVADDVMGIKLAQVGIDRIAGTSDDYTILLQYAGITSNADLVVHFEDIAGFAFCQTSGVFIAANHVQITSADLYFDNGYNWYFNNELLSFTVTPTSSSGGQIAPNLPQTVVYGESATFTITPDSDYYLNFVSGCAGTLSGSTYTTEPIGQNCNVEVDFMYEYTETGIGHTCFTDINDQVRCWGR